MILLGFTSGPWHFLYSVIPAILATYLAFGYSLHYGLGNILTVLTLVNYICVALTNTSTPILLRKLRSAVPEMFADKQSKAPEYKALLGTIVLCLVAEIALLIVDLKIATFGPIYLYLPNIFIVFILGMYAVLTMFTIGSVLAQFTYECKMISVKTEKALYSTAVEALEKFR